MNRCPARYPLLAAQGPDLTPFIDIVFNLIIFFLCSGTAAGAVFARDIRVPAVRQPAAETAPPRLLTVEVGANGSLALEGKTQTAETLRRRFAEAAALGRDAVPVRLRADRAVPFSAVRRILQLAAEAGLSKITFAVREADRP